MAHPRPHRDHHAAPVHRITEAHEAHAVDQSSRVRKYTISMSVRMLCFVAAFFTHGPLQWLLLVGAVVLPYIAVVIANRGADITKREPPAEFFTHRDRIQLETAPAAGPETQPGDVPEHEVIDGSWAEEPQDPEPPVGEGEQRKESE